MAINGTQRIALGNITRGLSKRNGKPDKSLKGNLSKMNLLPKSPKKKK